MFSPSILDTFIIVQGKIYLKSFHVQRSFEAYQLVFPHSIGILSGLEKIYTEIETRYSHGEAEMMRLTFYTQNIEQYKIEIVKTLTLPQPIRLEIITSLRQPAGRGKQNYKWSNRERWAQLLSAQQTDADDIIAVNQFGQLTETSRFNLFIYDSKLDQVITPSLDSGCINGVFRRYALSEKSIDLPRMGKKVLVEKDISYSELESSQKFLKVYVANSARGVLPECLILKN